MKNVSGEALRVDANDGRRRVDIAEGQSDSGLNSAGRRCAFKAKDAKVCPACGEIGVGHLANGIERHINSIDSEARCSDSKAWLGRWAFMG
jgi:hypothetical protein